MPAWAAWQGLGQLGLSKANATTTKQPECLFTFVFHFSRCGGTAYNLSTWGREAERSGIHGRSKLQTEFDSAMPAWELLRQQENQIKPITKCSVHFKGLRNICVSGQGKEGSSKEKWKLYLKGEDRIIYKFDSFLMFVYCSDKRHSRTRVKQNLSAWTHYWGLRKKPMSTSRWGTEGLWNTFDQWTPV